MKLQNKRERLFFGVVILYILYIAFPLFGDFLKLPPALPSIFVSILVILLYPSAWQTKPFRWFIAYAVILALYVFVGKPLTIGIGTVADSKKILIEYAYLLPPLLISGAVSKIGSESLERKIGAWALAILVASYAYILPLVIVNSGILRDTLFTNGEVRVTGLPTYGLMHAYILLVPVVCYGLKYSYASKKDKIVNCFILLLLCFVIYKTSITTCLILMMAAVLFSIIYKAGNRTRNVMSLVIISIISLLFYFAGVFETFIDWLLPLFYGTPVEYKLIDIKLSLEAGHAVGGTITVRQSLHQLSWTSFFRNPIFGIPEVGNHSSLIDRLGGMGLFCFIPFIFIIISHIKSVSHRLPTKVEVHSFYNLSIVVCFVLMYMKGNWGSESWLFMMVLIPSVMKYFYGRNERSGYR